MKKFVSFFIVMATLCSFTGPALASTVPTGQTHTTNVSTTTAVHVAPNYVEPPDYYDDGTHIFNL